MWNVVVLLFFVSTDGKYTETKSSQEKFLWSNVMIDQMIDIICSDHLRKKKFRNQKFTAKANIFEKIVDWMNKTAANIQRYFSRSAFLTSMK